MSWPACSTDARPTCPQCHRDPSFLAKNSGVMTAITGPHGNQPSQFGELTCFAITKDANADAAKLVEFLLNGGYLDWLALAPKARSRSAWAPPISPTSSPTPGSAWRPASSTPSPCPSCTRLPEGLGHQHRHHEPLGFPQGQGRLVGAQLASLPIPKALAAALNGTLSPAAAAEQAQADLETIKQSIS